MRRSLCLLLLLLPLGCRASRTGSDSTRVLPGALESSDAVRSDGAAREATPPEAAADRPIPVSAERRRELVMERLFALGTEDNRVMEHLRHLTKAIGPRLTSSSGIERAQDWARDRFRSFGLESWLEDWGTFPVGFDRGEETGRLIQADGRELDLEFITNAWSAGTEGARRGPAVLEAGALEEGAEAGALTEFDEALLASTEGAWIVLRSEGRPSRKRRDAFLEAAYERGALGAVTSIRGKGLMVTGGNHRIDGDDLPQHPLVRLRDDHYALLREALEDNALGLEFDLPHTFRPGPVMNRNVIADFKGVEFPDEVVICQAHIDSWDGAEGAADNGTGTSIVMEAARLLVEAGARPRRTIRFVLYSGEEQGLFGSSGYVRDHEAELDQISAVFNHDHGTQFVSGIGATAPMMEDLQRAFAPIIGFDPERPFEIREIDGMTPGPSDHAPFVRAGVPGFFWDQSQEGYERIHHTQYDTLEEVDPPDLVYSALLVAVGALGVANLDGKLDRTDMRLPPPRRMGVFLAGGSTKVDRVTDEGMAKKAGWKAGDVVLSVDGARVERSRDLVAALQEGGSRKVVVIQRGEEKIETILDYTGEPDEEERIRRAARKSAE